MKKVDDSFVANDLVEDPRLHEGVDEAGALGEGAFAAGQLLQNFLVVSDRALHVQARAVGQILAGVGLQQVHAHLQDGLEELPDVGIARTSWNRGVRQVAEDVVKLLVGSLAKNSRKLKLVYVIKANWNEA